MGTLPSSAKAKERVGLFLCSPSMIKWQVIGWTLPFTQRLNNGDLNTKQNHRLCLLEMDDII